MTFRIFLDLLIFISLFLNLVSVTAVIYAVVRIKRLDQDQLSLAQILQTVVSKPEPTNVVVFNKTQDND